MANEQEFPCQKCHAEPPAEGSMWCRDCIDQERTCNYSGCGHVGDDVQDRYSFGYYAGHFCDACCHHYKDNCGLPGPKEATSVTELHEFEAGGWDAVDGEPEDF